MWEQFEKQKHRGVQGFGAFDGHCIFKTPKQKKIKGWLRNNKHATDFLMFHHRQPTSTVNTKRAAHPFSSFDYFNKGRKKVRYVLVHNGHINNNKELKEAHEKLGIRYSSQLHDGTFNDSESLLWDVALTLEGKQDKLKAYGGIAFVCAKLVNGELTHLYFGKNPGRPLNLYREKDGLLLSSEGAGESIDDHYLYTYNYQLNRLTRKHLRVPSFNPETVYSSQYVSDWRSPGRTHIPQRSNRLGTTYDTNGDEHNYYIDHNGQRIYYDEFGQTTRSGRLYTGGTTSHCTSRNLENLVEGIDYWTDTDGEIIFFEDTVRSDDEDEALISDIIRADNRRGKSEDDLVIEGYEQQWFLNEYQGRSINSDVNVWQVYSKYMTTAQGRYEEAFDTMDSDLSYFAAQAKTDKRDLIISMIEEAIQYIYTQEGWHSPSSVDPFFVEPLDTPPIRTHNNQVSLLGAGQEG